MSTTYIVTALLGAAMAGFSAASILRRASWVVEPLGEYGVPRSWWPWLAAAKAAGAVGLLAGLVVPAIGVAAGIGLVLYFTGAVLTVLRARSSPAGSSTPAWCAWPKRSSVRAARCAGCRCRRAGGSSRRASGRRSRSCPLAPRSR